MRLTCHVVRTCCRFVSLYDFLAFRTRLLCSFSHALSPSRGSRKRAPALVPDQAPFPKKESSRGDSSEGAQKEVGPRRPRAARFREAGLQRFFGFGFFSSRGRRGRAVAKGAEGRAPGASPPSSTPSFRSLSTSPPDALTLSGAAHTSGESRRSEEELRGSRGLFGGDPLPGCSEEDGDGQHAGEMPADLDSKN